MGEAAAALRLTVESDSNSAVLELNSGDCLTLCFPKVEDRDRFAICMRIFAAVPKRSKWERVSSEKNHCGAMTFFFADTSMNIDPRNKSCIYID